MVCAQSKPPPKKRLQKYVTKTFVRFIIMIFVNYVQLKATEQHFPVVMFIMLYKVAVTFESVGKILNWDESNKRYRAVLVIYLFIMISKMVLTFKFVDEILIWGELDESS